MLVTQQRVVQPPYVGILNSFSPVMRSSLTALCLEKMLGMISVFFEFTKARFMAQDVIYPGEKLLKIPTYGG